LDTTESGADEENADAEELVDDDNLDDFGNPEVDEEALKLKTILMFVFFAVFLLIYYKCLAVSNAKAEEKLKKIEVERHQR